MQAKKNKLMQLITGLILLGFTALLLVVGLWSSSGRSGDSMHRFRASLDSALGLVAGTEIRYRGDVCGRVEAIRLVNLKPHIDMVILPTITLTEDASVRLMPVTPLGGSYLELLPGKPGGDVLHSGSELSAATPLPDLNRMVDMAVAWANRAVIMLSQAQSVWQSIETMPGKADRLSSLSERLSNAVEGFSRLRVHAGRAEEMIDRSGIPEFAEIDTVIGKLEKLTARAREIQAAMRAAQSAPSLAVLVDKLDKITERITAVAASYSGLLEKLNRVTLHLRFFDERFLRTLLQEQGITGGTLSPSEGLERIRKLEGSAP